MRKSQKLEMLYVIPALLMGAVFVLGVGVLSVLKFIPRKTTVLTTSGKNDDRDSL